MIKIDLLKKEIYKIIDKNYPIKIENNIKSPLKINNTITNTENYVFSYVSSTNNKISAKLGTLNKEGLIIPLQE